MPNIRYGPTGIGVRGVPARPPAVSSPMAIATKIADDLCARGYVPEAGVEPWIEAIALAITAERQRGPGVNA